MNTGDVINHKYHLVEFLGRGGFGETWKARHQSLGTFVCIKLLLPHRQDAVNAERFRREASAAAQVHEYQRNHVVQIQDYDIWTLSGGPPVAYVVMELLDGSSLQQILELDRVLDVQRAVRLVLHLLEALSTCHLLKVLHRDVHPGNLFVVGAPPNERGVLIDFGLCLPEGAARVTRSSEGAGTIPYLAPEIFEVGLDDIGYPADVYSAGAVLYRCLTGYGPHEDNPELVQLRARGAQRVVYEAALVPHRRSGRAPTPANHLNSQVSSEIAAVLGKALMPKAEDRYHTPHKFLEALSVAATPTAMAPRNVPPSLLRVRSVFTGAPWKYWTALSLPLIFALAGVFIHWLPLAFALVALPLALLVLPPKK